ncbi:alpha-glucosidase-like [Microplitis mediator]|uniref:alpha-glucosidase-like n=1 Tax=Microplitis mediator TaxID=375433 RepID=UPI0025537C25|nr:alpha-glucosidase-like [Microplitis mediator]
MLRRTLLVLFLCTLSEYTLAQNADEWWRDTFVYQVYPRSFKDGNGDGVGDLNGITSKLEHLADLGISALWLSPIYTSPMVDFGYDIANFTNIDSIFGTLDDFSRLVAKAKTLKLKVVLDFVPNHSSDKHAWFPKSVQKIKPYDEYYIWKDAKMVNGTRKPPNNWLSAFQGSAWTWNDQRKQYYLHQFAAGQPDLNYRSTALQEEMKNVLRFWTNRGVDGIRIDTIPNLIEDSRFLDEPKIPNTGLPDTDPGTLQHIYTADQDETYDILKSWRQVLDSSNGTRKIILTEAWTSLSLTMKYYNYGSNVPFNFMFINQLNNQSSPLDFKRIIDRYLNSIPQGQQPNWVVGNHDSHRAGSRYGEQRADQIPMIAAVLPGVGVLYNGDEIGMIDRPLSWAETVDPAGCNAGPGRYNVTSRDPERTPFQWDSTTSAGFSTNPKTWLPVHPNYKTLNLAAQKSSPTSHYGITKQLVALKKDPIIRTGSTQLIVAGENVLGIVRRLDQSRTIALLINFANKPITIDASAWLNIPTSMSVLVASVGSKIAPGIRVNTAALNLPAAASVILK